MSSTIEQIKARLNVVDVVSTYIKLDKAGVNWKARCPFHQEKTASFFVSPVRQSFYCFGCNKGGDLITFVEEMEGLDFIGALKVLAERAGVELVPERAAHNATRGNARLHETLAAAQKYYEQVFISAAGASAREYITSRGLSGDTVKLFGLGFAPAGWQGLCDALAAQGYTGAELEAAGLAIRSPRGGGRGYYDRFRDRVMFPLTDAAGRVVGFSGRLLPTLAPGESALGGKYINSPQTAVYDKSRFLYGFDKAKVAIRRLDYAILVEGQMDLLMCHQAGFANAVAVSGTALTTQHLQLLRRLTSNIVMAFDGDRAGQAASQRAIGLALSLGFEVKVLPLPTGLDPADLIKTDLAEWKRLLASTKHIIDFTIESVAARGLERRRLAHALREEVYPYLHQLAHRLDRAHYLGKIAGLAGLSEEVIRADLAEHARTVPSTGGRRVVVPNEVEPGAVPESRRRKIEDKLLGLWHWQRGVSEPVLPLERLEARLREQGVDTERSAEPATLEAELAHGGGTSVSIVAETESLLTSLAREILKERLHEAMSVLAQAEAGKSEEVIAAALKACQDISHQLRNLHAITL